MFVFGLISLRVRDECKNIESRLTKKKSSLGKRNRSFEYEYESDHERG